MKAADSDETCQPDNPKKSLVADSRRRAGFKPAAVWLCNPAWPRYTRNTAIVGPSGGNVGIGFATPINMARTIADQLITYGEVRRGQLGISLRDVDSETAHELGIDRPRGVLVSSVVENSPAQTAGLRSGDLIVAVDGKPVHSSADLRNRVGLMRVGSIVTIDLLRAGQPLSVPVRLGSRLEAHKRQRLHPPAKPPPSSIGGGFNDVYQESIWVSHTLRP